MGRRGFRPRLTNTNITLAVAALVVFLAVVRGASGPPSCQVIRLVRIIDPADHTRPRMEAHARRLVSPEIVDRARSDPRRGSQGMLRVGGISVENGTVVLLARADSEQEACTFARAVVDAYDRDQGPGRVDGGPAYLSHDVSWSRSTLDRPWKVVAATTLAVFLSASILLVPLAREGRAIS